MSHRPSRQKKLSLAMRRVDDITRGLVQKNRLDALEGDNMFDFDQAAPEDENKGENQQEEWQEEVDGEESSSSEEQESQQENDGEEDQPEIWEKEIQKKDTKKKLLREPKIA